MSRIWWSAALVAVVLVSGCHDRVHVGGERETGIPAHVEVFVADGSGVEISDGSLGELVVADDDTWHYRAPLRVPAGAATHVHERASGKRLWSLELTEGRGAYLRPFDALASEPGGQPGTPALGKTEREDPVAGRARIIAELDRAQAAGINMLLVEAYYHGYTMWPTEVGRQRPSSLSGGVAVYGAGGPVAGEVTSTWDPLAVYLEEGHARGIEIHAWFEVYYVWTRYFQSPPHTTPSASSWLWAHHPEWFNSKRADTGAGEIVSVAEDGKFFLDPRHPEVTDYNLALISELYARYPALDGVQLDYIRYPVHKTAAAPSWYGAPTYRDYFGFNPVTFAAFEAQTGISADQLDPADPTGPAWDTFDEWKAAAVTEFVGDVRALTDSLAPHVALSVSVFPNFADGATKMQDTRAWIEQSLVDIVMPQLYYTSIGQVEAIGDPFLDLVRGKATVYPTFYLPHFYDVAAGELKPGGADYLSYPAQRDVEGSAIFSLTGSTIGISAAAAADLTAPGAQWEHPARPSHGQEPAPQP